MPAIDCARLLRSTKTGQMGAVKEEIKKKGSSRFSVGEF